MLKHLGREKTLFIAVRFPRFNAMVLLLKYSQNNSGNGYPFVKVGRNINHLRPTVGKSIKENINMQESNVTATRFYS